jgi:D-serine deaminase-like pyridoxal phosphate-dependent protein
MVISFQAAGQSIIDAALMVLTTDNGMPVIISQDGLKLLNLNEEHGIVRVDPEKVQPEVGMYVEIIPSHPCTKVNLHNRY